MNQKAAPGPLARVILALAGRSGKKMSRVLEEDKNREGLPKRTTIRVETEKLLIVRSERTTSSSSREADNIPSDPHDDRRGQSFPQS